MAKLYYTRPSMIIGLVDPYTSYCFDEACAYIMSRIKDGEEPDFSVKDKGSLEKKHYKSPSEMYKSMGYKNGRNTKLA